MSYKPNKRSKRSKKRRQHIIESQRRINESIKKKNSRVEKIQRLSNKYSDSKLCLDI